MTKVAASVTALLEAVLFVANEPLGVARLAQIIEHEEATVQQGLRELGESLAGRGLQLTELDGQYRLVTTPAADGPVRRYLQAEARAELSRPALETLAIVAYRGPVTRAQLDELRGVASETMLRNLLQRGLIAEKGAAEEPGHPTLYGVSQTFLQHFGLGSLSELPPLPEADSTEAAPA
ncbi:MAG TPA: SMC-Scp complex subunit ScpB [Candidatus Saccharimonadia bacterium]|nr:SMC-Scp complex subunit ScpB [Candidatus Saccharimonadia bacterium]